MKKININLKKLAVLGISLMMFGFACALLQKICTEHEYLEQTKSELLISFIFMSVSFIGCVIFGVAIVFKIKNDASPKLSDLSMIPQQDKNKIIKDFSEITSKHTLELFMMLGLKNHIECMIVNDYNGEEFIFSFKKLIKKEQVDEINNELEKPMYYVMNVCGEVDEVDSLEEAKKRIRIDYVEEGEVHPDIESVFVVQKIMSTRYCDRLKTIYFQEHK